MSRRNKQNPQTGAPIVPKQEPAETKPLLSETTEQPTPIVVPDAADVVVESTTDNQAGVVDTADSNEEQPTTVVEDAPAPIVPEPPAVVPTPEPTPVVAVTEEPDTIHTFLKKKYSGIATLPTVVLGIIDKLDAYVAAMGINVPVTEEIGTRHQLALSRVYTTALDLPAGGHALALDVIIWYVSKHRGGAFSDRLAARFLNTTSFPPERQRTFVSLTNLFTILANPATRKDLNKHVNMDVVVRNIPSLTHRRNLLSYVSK
jgi:hypothetical protein